MKGHSKFIIGVLALGAFLLSACGGDSASSDTFDPVLPLGFDLGDPELKATDPTAAALAKGEPQVVEFFAFW